MAAIGDGGNDVSMIQAANVGIGIVGKEGKQASLAADFSITEFGHISRLLVWHGRNRLDWSGGFSGVMDDPFVCLLFVCLFSSYKRSAALSQFVIHRGLIISVMQVRKEGRGRRREEGRKKEGKEVGGGGRRAEGREGGR